MRVYTTKPVAERFWPKVERWDPDECWEWTGARAGGGYAQIQVNLGRGVNKSVLVHRLSYEMHIGPIPEGLTIDHLCGNTTCVNPKHMEPVTRRTNILRSTSPAAINARKTHCPQGHPYTENRNSYGERVCRPCRAAHLRRWQRNRTDAS